MSEPEPETSEITDEPDVMPRPDVSKYLRKDLHHDLMAGLTVAILGVPQGMAYAWIAGLPPIYGLYTSIISCIIGALLGSSSHLITGPTNASCMVIFSVTAKYIGSSPEKHLEAILLLTLMVGVIKLLFGILRFGGIVRYVSNSVLIGFTSGVAILIVGNQLGNILGVQINHAKADRFYKVIYFTLREIPHANFYPFAVAAITVGIVVIARRISAKLPGPILAIVFASCLVHYLGWHDQGVKIVSDISLIKSKMAFFHFPSHLVNPNLALFEELLAGALAVAIFGLIEASTSARGVAALSRQRLDFSREFVGQGIANIVGAFFFNFASSGSFVRTSLNLQSGARTRMAAIFSAIFILLTILFLAPFANYIPQASLAGMLVYVAWGMISKQKERILITWKSRGNSRLLLIVTLAATLLIPLQYAIFVGMFCSIIILLKITGTADLTLLVPRPNGRFEEVPFEQKIDSSITLVNIEGDLYFAAVENLDYDLQLAMGPHTRVVVLRMKRLRAIGSTAMTMLEHFWQMLREQDVSLVVCGVEKGLAGMMQRSGLSQSIGEPNIFYADSTLFQATELAVARARGIVEMERTRAEALQIKDPGELKPTSLTAGDLMTRNCIRFGQGHSLREAVWLLSQVYQRTETDDAQPLFLQNTEAQLAGSVKPWRLLEEMMKNVSPDEYDTISDAELGERFSKSFPLVIGDLARKDLPRLNQTTPLVALFRASLACHLRVLPIRDDGDRVIGLLGQGDLLKGLAQTLNVIHAPKEE